MNIFRRIKLYFTRSLYSFVMEEFQTGDNLYSSVKCKERKFKAS